jgi:hypothetical protein
MGIPLLLGRDVDDRDVLGERDVMVVNESFAAGHLFINGPPRLRHPRQATHFKKLPAKAGRFLCD